MPESIGIGRLRALTKINFRAAVLRAISGRRHQKCEPDIRGDTTVLPGGAAALNQGEALVTPNGVAEFAEAELQCSVVEARSHSRSG